MRIRVVCSCVFVGYGVTSHLRFWKCLTYIISLISQQGLFLGLHSGCSVVEDPRPTVLVNNTLQVAGHHDRYENNVFVVSVDSS